MMDPKWLEDLIANYEAKGWQVVRNDEEKLCFSLYEDEDHEWFLDYSKKDGSCIGMLVCRRD